MVGPLDLDHFDLIDLPVFVLQAGISGHPVYAGFNRRAQELSGLNLEQVNGKTAADIFGGRLGDRALQRQSEAWNRGRQTTYETPLPVSSSTMWVRTTLVPVNDEQGQMTHMVGTSVDITAERESLESDAKTRTLTTELEEFVTMAAHDLRSPIGNVQSLANLLRDGFVDLGDGKLAMIDALEEVSTKALELIHDMLTHATDLTGAETVRSFDLADLCEDVLLPLDPMRQHDIFLDQVVVHADYAATQVILRNLFDNAIKHAGIPAIMIEVTASERVEGKVTLVVRDNGNGFADPETVFGGAITGGPSGGFGLVGTRRLIRARGGSIRALPIPGGQGAQVEFTLPGYLVRAEGYNPAAMVS